MVAPTKWTTFDGGTEGASANAANTASGSGDPIANPSGSGGTALMLAAAAIRGAKGVRYKGTGTSVFHDRAITVGSGDVGVRTYFKIDSTTLVNTANLSFRQIRNSTASMANVILQSTRVMLLQDMTGTKVTFNGGTALPTGSYIVQFSVKKGTTTANGTLSWWLRNAVTGAFIDGPTTITNANTGTTDATIDRLGKTSSTGNLDFFDVDEPAHVEGSGAEIDLVPQITSLTPITTTNAAVALGRTKKRTLTPAAETDAVVALVKTDRIERTLTPAAETDAVVATGRAKRRTLNPVTETDTAIALAKTDPIWRTLTVTTETDAVVALVRTKARTLNPAAETDAAVTLVKTDRIERTLTPAGETDAVVALGRKKSRTTGTTAETDTTTALGRVESKALGVTAETDAAVNVTGGTTTPGTIVRDLTPGAETDAAQALARKKSKTLAVATEADSVATLGRSESKALSPASESDAVTPVGRTKSRSLAPAGETETVVHLTAVSIRTLTTAAETEAAVGLTHAKSKGVAPAPETGAAWALVAMVQNLRDITATGILIRDWHGALTREWDADLEPRTRSAVLVRRTRDGTLEPAWRGHLDA